MQQTSRRIATSPLAPSGGASTSHRCLSVFRSVGIPRQARRAALRAFKVEIEHAGGVATLTVEEGTSILETALDAGLDLSHDCKMGVSRLVAVCDKSPVL